jgi:Leucine-rich repeat (LRR) protein
LRFRNSNFTFASNRRPFKNLVALEFHMVNLSSDYLANSIFDESIISELSLQDAHNFIGFVDVSDRLPTGKLLHRFIATRSYKIDAICSHALPSFIDQETFHEIIIKKCTSLSSITAFTFYKYTHLKKLILSDNNFNRLDKDSFRYLSELETLDLSNNPISNIEDYTFKDLSSLKNLYLQSTLLKSINKYTLSGTFELEKLILIKSEHLNYIHGQSFEDPKRTLKHLDLKVILDN